MNFTTKELYDKVLECLNSLKEINESKDRVSYSAKSAQVVVENAINSFNTLNNEYVNENNESPLFKYRMAKNLFEALSQYQFVDPVANLRNYIMECYKNNTTNFQVSNIVDTINIHNGSLYENLAKDLTSCVDSESINSDIKRIASKNPWNNQIKQLSESLDIQNHVAVSNDNCTISKVYSPIIMTNEGVVFHLHGKDYIIKNNTINECAKVQDLAYNNVLNGLSIAKINGDKINFYGKSKVLSFNVNEGTLMLGNLNLSESNSYDIKDAIIANQLYDYREIGKADIVAKFFESIDCLREMNNFTDISSKDFMNLYLTVIAVEEGYYVNTVNGGMGVNEMKKIDSAEKLVECAKSFIKYDLSNVVLESLVKEGNEKAEMETKRNEINATIKHLEEKKEQINSAISRLGKSAELDEALNLITNEIRKNEKALQKTYESFRQDDNFVEGIVSKTVDSFKAGDKIQVNALDYTTKGKDEEIEVIYNGNQLMLCKKYIDVKLK